MGKKKSSYPTLDLHGVKTSEVADLVDRFLVKNESKKRVRILCGKGTGAVRKAVTNYLKLGHFPWEFESAESSEKNIGSMIVFLGD